MIAPAPTVDASFEPAPATGASREAVEPAPAKINLALHVTGRRADGYHLLDTLVTHGGAEDRVFARRAGDAPTRAPRIALALTGPRAAGLSAEADNLVTAAARALAAEAARLGRGLFDVDLTLEKHLPIASGIGGGSSDAAATLRLLDRLWGLGLSPERLAEIGLPLGADVPMCVWGRPARVGGIGEAIEAVAPLPAFRLVLVNPGVPVATSAVFRALERRDNPPLPPLPARFATLDELVDWLGNTRNDLEAAAIAVAPEIARTLDWLRSRPGCRLARMSGSGATCFALFAADAEVTAADLPAGWWSNLGR